MLINIAPLYQNQSGATVQLTAPFSNLRRFSKDNNSKNQNNST